MKLLVYVCALVCVCAGIVSPVTGQGQVPPSRRGKPPFIIVPPENERLKGAASEVQEVVTIPFQPPEVVLAPVHREDDTVLTPDNSPDSAFRPNFRPQPEENPSLRETAHPLPPPLPPAPPVMKGVDVSRLLDRQCYNCLCQASTNCTEKLGGCVTTGPNQYFCGIYHISWAYWFDSGKPGDVPHDPLAFERCLKDRDCAERSILGYMTNFQRDCNRDGVIDCVDFAMIHKAGPKDCNAEWVWNSAYWKRFLDCWGSPLDFRILPKTGKKK